MYHIQILSENSPPALPSAAIGWPGIRVSVAGGLSLADIVERLGKGGPLGAVIVETTARDDTLAAALAALPCPSVEVLPDNPCRYTDGRPNFDATPAGADCIVYGLGADGFDVAISLLAERLGGKPS